MNQIKRLIIISFGLLVSASQCSGRAAAASNSQSVEPDYGLISHIDNKEKKEELLRVLRGAGPMSNYPMIAQSVGLPHGSRMIFLADNHVNPICCEVVTKIMETNKIDKIYIEGEMFDIYNSWKIKSHSDYCVHMSRFFSERSINTASAIAVREAFKCKVKIPVESIEFDDVHSAISYFGNEKFQMKDLIALSDSQEESKHPLFFHYCNLRDRRMAWNIMCYLEGLKKQETCLVIVGYAHLHNLKPFLRRYVGAFNGMVDYETFQYVEDLKFEQD